MSKAKTYSNSFNCWIRKFEKEKSDRGIFARWFSDRGGMGYSQNKTITKRAFMLQLARTDCSQFIQDSFENLWNEFELIPNAIIIPVNKTTLKRKIRRI